MSHLMNMHPALLGAISGRKGRNVPIAEMTKKQAQRALNKAVARATVTGDGGAFMSSSSTGKRIDRLARHVEKKQKQQDIRKLARTLVPNTPAPDNTNNVVQNDDAVVNNNTGNGSGNSGGGGDGGGGFTFDEGGGSAEDTLFSSLAPTNDPNAPAGTVQVGPDGQPVEASAGGGKFVLIGAAALAAWFFLRKKKRGRRK